MPQMAKLQNLGPQIQSPKRESRRVFSVAPKGLRPRPPFESIPRRELRAGGYESDRPGSADTRTLERWGATDSKGVRGRGCLGAIEKRPLLTRLDDRFWGPKFCNLAIWGTFWGF
jgi:hypothetical protein